MFQLLLFFLENFSQFLTKKLGKFWIFWNFSSVISNNFAKKKKNVKFREIFDQKNEKQTLVPTIEAS